MKKGKALKTTKLQKMFYAAFIMLMCSSLAGGITAFAAKDGTTTNWRVTKAASVQDGLKNIGRYILWEGLLGLGNIADSFNKAIDKLLSINLYSLVGSQFNISSSVYPIAGAILCFSITLVGFLIILKAHNGNHLERLSTMLGSLILLAALPSLISAASDIKSAGTRWAKDSFEIDGGYEYNDDGTVTPQSLGNTLIVSNVYDMGKSIDKNTLKRVDQKTSKANAININEALDKTKYPMKPYPFKEVYVSDEIKTMQNTYDSLSLDDKINLIDRCYKKSNNPYARYSESATVGSLKKIWETHEDDYIEDGSLSGDSGYYCKCGGRTSSKDLAENQKIYCQIKRKSDGSWEPVRQVFKTDNANELIVYKAEAGLYKDPSLEGLHGQEYNLQVKRLAQRYIKWGDYWPYGWELGWTEAMQYEMCDYIYNYQHLLCRKLADEIRSPNVYSHLPKEAVSVLNDSSLDTSIRNASSLENALAILESVTIKHEKLEFSVMEWLNFDQNIDLVNILDDDDLFKSVGWVPLDSYSWKEDTLDSVGLGTLLSSVIEHFGVDFADEHLYAYHVDWFNAYVMLIITDICLLFAGFKIASLMFDVLFAEIVAPIAMASDVTGSGRAKQVVSNLIACNISFVAVIYIVRLFLAVLIAMNESPSKYTIVVKLFITLAGAKFVIDGPDLIVKLTGMDAGVKSGLSTIMGVRTAAQMAGGAARVANKGAGAVGGLAGGIASGAKNGKGIGGKLGSAALGGAAGMSAGARNGGLFGGAGAGSTAGKAVGDANGAGGKVAAAMGNSSAGQAFKSGATNQARTNDSFSGSQSSSGGSSDSSSSNAPISMTGKDGTDGKDGNDGMKGSDGKDSDNNQNNNSNGTANAPHTATSGGSTSVSSGGGSSVSGGSTSVSSGGGSSVNGGSTSVSSGGGSSVSGGSTSVSSGGGSSVSGGSTSVSSGGGSSVGSGSTYTPSSGGSASGSYSTYSNDTTSYTVPTTNAPMSEWEQLKDMYDNRIGDTTNWRGGKDANPPRKH